MKSPQLAVFQDGNAVAVGSNGEFRVLIAQVRQNLPEVRMHSVLARP